MSRTNLLSGKSNDVIRENGQEMIEIDDDDDGSSIARSEIERCLEIENEEIQKKVQPAGQPRFAPTR